MKTLLKVLFGILIFLIIIVAGFLYTFDANDYKKELIEIAEKITGRPISVAGSVGISLYPYIGIKVDNVTVENPPGFSKENFATIGQFDVKIEIMPLLQKRLNIETLVLNRLKINFEKNASGGDNWSDFMSTSKSDDVESKLGLAGLNIGGISVVDANITWLDVNTGKRFNVSKMKLTTDAVVKGQPLPITFNAYAKSSQPEWQGSVFVKSKFEFKDDSPVFNASDLKLVVKALLPSSKLEKVTFAMIADSEINVQTQKARLSRVRLSVLGMMMTGELSVDNIFSIPVIQGPLKVKAFEAQSLASQFKISIPPMAGAQSLKEISLKTLFKTDFDSIYLDNIVAKIDESQVNGYVHLVGMQHPVVSYDLDVDRINLHDYRTVDNEPGQDEMKLPLDLIRSSNLEGALDVETVVVDEIELKNLHVTSKIRDGILKAIPITMLVGESEVKATIQFDASESPVGMLTVNANNVDANDSINPLLKSIMGNKAINLEGAVAAEASLQATGMSMDALKSSAQGTLKINMDTVAIRGIDLDHENRSVVADYANSNNFRTRKSFVTKYEPDRITEFDNLSATINISGSNWVNNDLSLVSAKANIAGSGSVDLINRTLDYRPVVDMNVGNAIDIRDKLRDHPMEYHAHGTFENLSYEFNVDKYELLVGRLLLQEAKARSIKQKKQNIWQNIKSK